MEKKTVSGPADSARFYTGGSSLYNRTGRGIQSFRLPDLCNVFQAELAAIQNDINDLWTRANVHNTIYYGLRVRR